MGIFFSIFSSDEVADVELKGNRDTPGYAALPRFHPALCVGNSIAASVAKEAGEPFAFVLSAVPPRDAATFVNVPELSSTHEEFYFFDSEGAEKDPDGSLARDKIEAGAAAVSAALREIGDGRALVHCSWGQNRSIAICCAWAVIYGGWAPEDACAYAREAVISSDRRYKPKRPLNNEVFIAIVAELRRS